MHFRFTENLKIAARMLSERRWPPSERDDSKLLPNEHVAQEEFDDVPLPKNQTMDGPSYQLQHKLGNESPRPTLFVTAVVVVATATILTHLFPNVIVQTINDRSDAYCYVFFVSFACFGIMAVTVLTMKLLLVREVSIRPSIAFSSIVKLSLYYGFGGLAVFFGRHGYRVLCHLQEPLSAAILPFGVVCHLLVGAKVDSIRKLSCLAVAIVGLFICVEFQVLDEFSCPSHVVTVLNGDGMFWTSDEHAVWTVVYLVGFLFLALFFAKLAGSLNGSKAVDVISTVPTIECFSKSSSLNLMGTLVLCTWIQFFSWMTIALMFWIDLFSFFGRAESMSSFQEMMLNGIGCFVGVGGHDCAAHAAGRIWTFAIFSAILFVAVVHLMVTSMDTCSVAFTLALVTLSLPLNTLWSSVFRIDDDDGGLRWSPHLNGETIFTFVGLPVMILGLILYRYFGNREKSRISNA